MSHTREIRQLSLSGEVLGVFKSITEASRKTGYNPGCIHNSATNGWRTGEFLWEFVEDVHKRRIEALSKGKVVLTYPYLSKGKKDGFLPAGIRNCLTGKVKTYKGYQWRYAEN